MKSSVILILVSLWWNIGFGQPNLAPKPSMKPNEAQLEQIKRKYGMFMHFGINTFVDEEWTDGSVPAKTYNPPIIDADQWIRSAKAVGMKYVILITKHHDGFCLWDSKFTTYDVGSSGNTTNVVEAVAKACKKYNIGLGLYYSLWDRKQNSDTKDQSLDAVNNQYTLNQLGELLAIAKKEKVNVVEFWFDGGWLKANDRWPVQKIYNTIKSQQPNCLIGINWSIGAPGNADKHMVLPTDQKEGYPIRYFPSDFRLGDPYMPANPDPKIFTNAEKSYYMPWESTICLTDKWFYNTKDDRYKPTEELYKTYQLATAQDNILIINSPPGRNGKIREKDIEALIKLRERISKK